jgi:hypothetical protein
VAPRTLLKVGEKLPKQLLVEGPDDFHALCNLFESRNIPQSFGIKEKDGYPNLLSALDVEIDSPGLTAVGIIVDADENLKDRWKSLRKRLIELGYTNLPDEPEASGTIPPPIENLERPTIGIWIMPNNQRV